MSNDHFKRIQDKYSVPYSTSKEGQYTPQWPSQQQIPPSSEHQAPVHPQRLDFNSSRRDNPYAPENIQYQADEYAYPQNYYAPEQEYYESTEPYEDYYPPQQQQAPINYQRNYPPLPSYAPEHIHAPPIFHGPPPKPAEFSRPLPLGQAHFMPPLHLGPIGIQLETLPRLVSVYHPILFDRFDYQRDYVPVNHFKEPTFEDQLVKGLIFMAKSEANLERLRLNLAAQQDFIPQTLFYQFLNDDQSGQITEGSFQVGCAKFSIVPDATDVKLVFQEHGSFENVMEQQEFIQMFEPRTSIFSVHHSQNEGAPTSFSQATKQKIRDFFVGLLNYESALEEYRQEFQEFQSLTEKKKRFHNQEQLDDFEIVYHKIFAVQGEEQEQRESLMQFLHLKGHFCSAETVESLIQKIDRNKSSYITIQEFKTAFMPRINERYQ